MMNKHLLAVVRHYQRKLFAVSSNCPAPFATLAGNYDEIYRESIRNPEDFWDSVAKNIDWFKPYKQVLDNSNPPFTRWFVGGELNTCYNALDRHVSNGKGNQLSVIYDSPITSKKSSLTYNELLHVVSRFAGALALLGVKKGDCVVIYMPMITEIIVAMLAITRLGAIHSVVFGGFSSKELAKRIDHCNAKVVIAASCGLEPSRIVKYKPILDEALNICKHQPKHCIIYQRNDIEIAHMSAPRDIDWNDAMERAQPHDPVPVNANDPVYILYTSGTTGLPKGIVRPTGGHAVVLPWTMKTIYGMESTDVWWAISDIGWVVGHSYICYAPLMNGNTTIIYEGKPVGTPDGKQFFRVVSEYRARAIFTTPTALRSIAMIDPDGKAGDSYDISHLNQVFVAGEPLDHATRLWSEKAFHVPTLDHWWQTETGFPIACNAVGLNMPLNPPRGSVGKAFPGYNLKVISPEGKNSSDNELGRIICKLPLPPGNFISLHKADERFEETYFRDYPGYYDTMDAGYMDTGGYVYVHAREDDVINVAGHRISTLAIEEAILSHPDIVEVATVGVPDSLKGEVPLALFVVRSSSVKDEATLKKEVVAAVREHIGPVAAFRLCTAVGAMPKTRSGKVPRKSIADLAKCKQVIIPPTIEDPSVYNDIYKALQSIGFAIDAPIPIIS